MSTAVFGEQQEGGRRGDANRAYHRVGVMEFTKGVMDVPAFASGFMYKVPAIGAFIYTFNCALFGLGLMDSLLVIMMGTPIEKLPIVTDPITDALFLGSTSG